MADLAKLVVIGLDAMDKDLVLKMAHEGKLPAFARLMKDAAWGTTQNPPGMEAGATWGSFYSGVNPATHGMYYPFLKVHANSYEERQFKQDDWRGTPFWDVLSRAGKRVCVIDAPYTYLSSSVRGAHVVDWGTHAPMADISGFPTAFKTNPPELAAELSGKFGRDVIGFSDLLILKTAADFIDFRDKILDRAERKTRLAEHMLAKGDWDLFFIAFHEGHSTGHLCWHLHDKSHPRYDAAMAATVGDVVEMAYRALDRAVASLIEKAGPGARAIVLCSHGMGTNFTGSVLLDEILLRLEGFAVPETKNAVRRFVHETWLAAPGPVKRMLMPLRDALWPAVKSKLLQIPREKRKCYEIRNNDATGGIRLNLIGREPDGLLSPGREADLFVDHLIEDLMAVRVAKSGEPAINRVLRTKELYKGTDLDQLPDLLVEWNRNAILDRVVSPKIGELEHKDLPTRSGDHRPEGMFWAVGPGFPQGRLNEVTPIYDLAPTITRLLGVEQTRAEGKPIPALTGDKEAA